MDLVDERGGSLRQAIHLGLRRSVAAFDIQPQQLLHSADDSSLRDSRQRTGNNANRIYTCATQQGLQFALFGIGSPEPCKDRLTAESRKIHGHVRCAACALIPLSVAEHWYRCLRRDALDLAMNVAVKHDVSHNEDLELREFTFE